MLEGNWSGVEEKERRRGVEASVEDRVEAY